VALMRTFSRLRVTIVAFSIALPPALLAPRFLAQEYVFDAWNQDDGLGNLSIANMHSTKQESFWIATGKAFIAFWVLLLTDSSALRGSRRNSSPTYMQIIQGKCRPNQCRHKQGPQKKDRAVTLCSKIFRRHDRAAREMRHAWSLRRRIQNGPRTSLREGVGPDGCAARTDDLRKLPECRLHTLQHSHL
jgi:hypothetical protein